jgi:hypothetical protein
MDHIEEDPGLRCWHLLVALGRLYLPLELLQGGPAKRAGLHDVVGPKGLDEPLLPENGLELPGDIPDGMPCRVPIVLHEVSEVSGTLSCHYRCPHRFAPTG